MDKPESLEDFTEEQIASMTATYQAMLNHPETRKFALRATKKINPGTSIPEIDLEDAARAEFKSRDERQDKLEQEIRERDARDRIREERQRLRDAGHSKDDIAAIEKIMTDEHIPSYDTAAKYFAGSRALAEPAPSTGVPAPTFSMPTDALAAMKNGRFGARDQARQAAAAALDDIRAGRVKLPH